MLCILPAAFQARADFASVGKSSIVIDAQIKRHTLQYIPLEDSPSGREYKAIHNGEEGRGLFDQPY